MPWDLLPPAAAQITANRCDPARAPSLDFSEQTLVVKVEERAQPVVRTFGPSIKRAIYPSLLATLPLPQSQD
jgi:hypothetical protein